MGERKEEEGMGKKEDKGVLVFSHVYGCIKGKMVISCTKC